MRFLDDDGSADERWSLNTVEQAFDAIRKTIMLRGSKLRISGDEVRLYRFEDDGTIFDHAIASLPR
jgi:hypothetical protein